MAADHGAYAVGFDIRFGNQIKAHLAAHLGEPGGVGIVAGAHGVDVVLFHQDQILPGLLPADGVAGHGVAVVAVYPAKTDGHAVELHHASPHGDLPDAHLLGDHFLRGGEQQGVLHRVFGVPQNGMGDGKDGRSVRYRAGGQHLPIGREQGGRYRRIPHTLHRDGDGAGQRGAHGKIAHEIPGTEQQKHIAENAAHAQLVLILQIAAKAPLYHQHAQLVFALPQEIGHIKFRGAVRNLAVAEEQAVQPHIKTGVHSFKI